MRRDYTINTHTLIMPNICTNNTSQRPNTQTLHNNGLLRTTLPSAEKAGTQIGLWGVCLAQKCALIARFGDLRVTGLWRKYERCNKYEDHYSRYDMTCWIHGRPLITQMSQPQFSSDELVDGSPSLDSSHPPQTAVANGARPSSRLPFLLGES